MPTAAKRATKKVAPKQEEVDLVHAVIKKQAGKLVAKALAVPPKARRPRSRDMIERDISDELSRIVETYDQISGRRIPYVIENPQKMYYYNGGSTMRILDNRGEFHLVPAPGYRATIHRWTPRVKGKPVQW